jgi:multidrug efflux pump
VQAAINAGATAADRSAAPPIYSKVNPADAPILTLAVTSDAAAAEGAEPRRHALAQKISQLPGVGLVSIGGGQRPAVRVQGNPQALAADTAQLDDCASRSRRQRQPGKGSFDGPRAPRRSTPTTS